MPIPSAQYKVRYDGHVLPGFLQNEDMPIEPRNGRVDIINRDGGPMYDNGTNFRGITLNFNVFTRLDTNHTGIEHLGDCLEQYRDALRYVTRVVSASTLFFGETDHYLIARYTKASAPLSAPDHRKIGYALEFAATPWFYGRTQSVSTVASEGGTITLDMPDTRKTYPSFVIPPGIPQVTISHSPSNKSFTFSGSMIGYHITVNCGALTVKSSAGNNEYRRMASGPDFGIYHVGSGSCVFDISGLVGSGTIVTTMTPRLER